MKNSIALLIMFFLMACKNSNSTSGPNWPLPDSSVYAENKFMAGETSKFHRNILHAIFLHQTDFAQYSKFDSLMDLPFFKSENQDLKNRYAKVIVTSIEGDQLFYAPINSTAQSLLESLNIKKESNKKLVWVKENFHAGAVSVLAITAPDEILLNERNFENREWQVSDVDEIKLEKLSQFQKISFESSLKIADPVWSDFVAIVDEKKLCDRGDYKTHCECAYAISRPTNTYKDFKYNDQMKTQYQLVLNNQIQSLEGQSLELDLKNLTYPITLNLNFKKYAENNVMMTGRPGNNECTTKHTEVLNERKKLNYDVKIKTIGTSKTPEDLKELPFVLGIK